MRNSASIVCHPSAWAPSWVATYSLNLGPHIEKMSYCCLPCRILVLYNKPSTLPDMYRIFNECGSASLLWLGGGVVLLHSSGHPRLSRVPSLTITGPSWCLGGGSTLFPRGEAETTSAGGPQDTPPLGKVTPFGISCVPGSSAVIVYSLDVSCMPMWGLGGGIKHSLRPLLPLGNTKAGEINP